MFEQVYRLVQLGRESTLGTSVAATTRFPIDPSQIELDRASQYAATEDYGRSVRNHASRGYHGLRAASMPFSCDVRFQDIMHLLEMHYAGDITPTGTGPYTYVYPFEGGSSTLQSYTVEEGVLGSTQDEWEMPGVLVDDLTLEFDALAAPGAQPWRASGTFVGWDRAVASMTAALTTPTLETAMGHLTVIKEGTTATAFASLSELTSHLVRFSMSTNRNLVRRPYGSASDLPVGWGFSEKAGGTFEAMVKISSTAKTDFHDIWNSSGGSLGERRWRVTIDGSGNNVINIDARVGIFAVPVDERDGERVYGVTGEFVDDDTLTGPVAITVVNDVSAVP